MLLKYHPRSWLNRIIIGIFVGHASGQPARLMVDIKPYHKDPDSNLSLRGYTSVRQKAPVRKYWPDENPSPDGDKTLYLRDPDPMRILPWIHVGHAERRIRLPAEIKPSGFYFINIIFRVR